MSRRVFRYKKKIEQDVQILKNSNGLHKISLFLELKRIGKTVSEAHIDVDRLLKEYHIFTLDVHIDETVQKFHSSFDTFGEIEVRGRNKLNYQSASVGEINHCGGEFRPF